MRYAGAVCFGAEEEAPGVMSGQSEVAAALALSSSALEVEVEVEVEVGLGLSFATEVTSVDA